MKNRSEQINELATALSKAQGTMEAAKLNRTNPFYNSSYADLAAIQAVARKPLSDNGLSVTHAMELRDDNPGVLLIATLMHSSGQWIESHYPLPMTGKPQEVGSQISYAKRYTYAALVGVVADDDDDGNAAQKAAEKQNGRKPPAAAPSTIDPQEVAPPIDPETGELTPHTIQASKWWEFGQKMIAAIDTADDELEIDMWLQANEERLDKAAASDPQPNTYKIIMQRVKDRRSQLREAK